jgi:hypothetical protein
MLKAAVHRKFDMIAAWSVDRLGRSLQDLVGFLGELKAAGVDLFLHQQALDTSTPSGRALFQMLGVFAEFEAAMDPRENAGGSCPSARPGQTARTAANHAHGIRRRSALASRGSQHSQGGEASPRRHFDGAANQINRHKRRSGIAALVQKPVRRQSGQQSRWTSAAFQTRRAAAAGPVLIQTIVMSRANRTDDESEPTTKKFGRT